MAKSKQATALFEVLKKGKFPADLSPRGSAQAKPAPAEAPPEPPPAEEPAPKAAAEPMESARPSTPAEGPIRPAIDDGASAGPVRIDGGVIRMALSSTAAAFALFVLLAVVVVAFAVGRSIGFRKGQAAGFAEARTLPDSAPDALEAARQQKPTRDDLFEGVGTSPLLSAAESKPERQSESAKPPEPTRTESPSPASPEGWVKGLTYVCVQGFMSGARDDAVKAQEHLRQNGVETAIVDRGSGTWRYQLTTRRGFDWDDPAQKKAGEQYLARIREIGDRYYESGGRYRLEGYPIKLTRDRW
jgi:hypothetical protein